MSEARRLRDVLCQWPYDGYPPEVVTDADKQAVHLACLKAQAFLDGERSTSRQVWREGGRSVWGAEPYMRERWKRIEIGADAVLDVLLRGMPGIELVEEDKPKAREAALYMAEVANDASEALQRCGQVGYWVTRMEGFAAIGPTDEPAGL